MILDIAESQSKAAATGALFVDGATLDLDAVAATVGGLAGRTRAVGLEALLAGAGGAAAESYFKAGLQLSYKQGDTIKLPPGSALGTGWTSALAGKFDETSRDFQRALLDDVAAAPLGDRADLAGRLRAFADQAESLPNQFPENATISWPDLSSRLQESRALLAEATIELAKSATADARAGAAEVGEWAAGSALHQGMARRLGLHSSPPPIGAWDLTFPTKAARRAAELLELAPSATSGAMGLPATVIRWTPKPLHKDVAALASDLTARAASGELARPVGRFREIQEVIDRLASDAPGSRSASLLSESGTGKTAILEGVAHRIVSGDVPDALRNKRLLMMDLTALEASADGTVSKGDVALQKFFTGVEESRDPIFVDELHRLFGLGTHRSRITGYEAAFLEPMAEGRVAVVGATTHADLDKLRQYYPIDAFMRRLRPIKVEAPSAEEVEHIVRARALRTNTDSTSGPLVLPEGLAAVQQFGDRYLVHLNQPARAVGLLDHAVEAAAKSVDQQALTRATGDVDRLATKIAYFESLPSQPAAELADLRTRLAAAEDALHGLRSAGDAPAAARSMIGREQIADSVAQLIGARHRPGSVEERTMLRTLEAQLGERVKGQENAVAQTGALVRRVRGGMGDPARPGSILYTGGTGRGKTELAESVAEVLGGSREHLNYLAMGDYSTHGQGREFATRLSKMVTAHPGYPILLDEIEKAEPGARKVLLEVLEKGRLTNPETGATVRIPMGTVIATTNVSPGRFAQEFPPEFLNRFDDVAEFAELSPETIHSIAKMQLGRLAQRAREVLGMELTWSDEAVDRLAELGYNPDMGARPMRRAAQHEVGDKLALLALSDPPPTRVRVGVRDGAIVLDGTA